MEDVVYIVIWRIKKPANPETNKWKAQGDGVFEGPDAERLARNLAECLNVQSDSFEYHVVRGPIVSQETMEQAEARLGTF